MNFKEPQPGMTATLKVPFLGYTRIELVEYYRWQWEVRIIESGKEIFVFEDEFELD